MAVLGTVGFRYIGVYDATKEYVTGNVVTYDGSSYVMIKYASDGVSKTAVTGVAPDADDTTWKIMAEGISESKADAKLKEAVSTAEASAKKWAVGNDESITEGSDTDNAKAYAEQAKEAAEKASAVSGVGIATATKAGIVKVDDDTIKVDADGTIHGVSKITVDDALSDTSENPVQNKAIKAAIDAQKEIIGHLLILKITFSEEFNGKAYTVTGNGEIFTGTVPNSLYINLHVHGLDTIYTVSAEYESETYTSEVETKDFYGVYFGELTAWQATITVTVTDAVAGAVEGALVTATSTEKEYTQTTNTEGKAVIKVGKSGTYTIVAKNADGELTDTQEVVADTDKGTYTAEVRYWRATLLGFKIKKNESDPAARVTYTEMAEGLTPASTNLTTGAVDLGDFANFWFITENKPCMVKYDGTIDYYLDPDDYTKKEDGVTASDVSSTSYAGNAMAKIPLTWLKIWQDSTYIYVNICDTKLDDDYHAYAHTRADGTVMDHIFMAMFEGSLTSSKVRSLKGQSVMNSQTGANELTYAKANGSLWSTQSWSQINLINMLLVLLFKSTNLQATLGNGHYSGGSQASHLLTTGTISNKGQFYGTSGNVAMKCFHIENFYGDCWNRIEGCVTDANKQILIKPTPTYNTAGTGYTATGIIPGGTSGGYINAEEGKAYGIVPKTASGSDSTYTPDGLWFAASCYALVGGGCSHGLPVGPFALSLSNAVSAANWSFGAALSCEQPAA